MFTQPAFIRKNTPELRKKLRNMGYRVFPDLFSSPCLSCLRTTAFPSSEDNPDKGIDCGENEKLFIALAALRDDSDFLQWFVWDRDTLTNKKGKWMLSYVGKMRVDMLREGYYHKATVKELIEHFVSER